MSSRASSVRLPRSRLDSPTDANSMSSWPVPMPSTTRPPPERLSRVATSLAVMVGWRNGAQRMAVPSRMRSVAPAATASVIIGSCQATEYTLGATSRWSITHSPLKPASSTLAKYGTSARAESGVVSGPA